MVHTRGKLLRLTSIAKTDKQNEIPHEISLE